MLAVGSKVGCAWHRERQEMYPTLTRIEKPAHDLNLIFAFRIGAVGPLHRPAVEIAPQGSFDKDLWAQALEVRLEEGRTGQKNCAECSSP